MAGRALGANGGAAERVVAAPGRCWCYRDARGRGRGWPWGWGVLPTVVATPGGRRGARRCGGASRQNSNGNYDFVGGVQYRCFLNSNCLVCKKGGSKKRFELVLSLICGKGGSIKSFEKIHMYGTIMVPYKFGTMFNQSQL